MTDIETEHDPLAVPVPGRTEYLRQVLAKLREQTLEPRVASPTGVIESRYMRVLHNVEKILDQYEDVIDAGTAQQPYPNIVLVALDVLGVDLEDRW